MCGNPVKPYAFLVREDRGLMSLTNGFLLPYIRNINGAKGSSIIHPYSVRLLTELFVIMLSTKVHTSKV